MANDLPGGIDRREFLGASAGFFAGLILSGEFTLESQNRRETFTLNAWVRVGTDDTVTLIASQAEMGQGAGTTLPAILAEELGADWKRVRLEQATVDPAYRNPRLNWQFTGNSESTTGFFELLRQMGASARAMLVSAAAEQWKVPPEECVTESGVVLHTPSGRSLRFGELADQASRRTPPKDVELKQRSEWKLLGKPLGRVDIPAKLDGSAVFGIDFRLPGMLYAAIALAPVFGGKVKKYDRTPAISMPGVVDVVEIPDGIAVVADNYWRAGKALAQTPIEWDDGANASVNTASLMAQYRAAMDADQWMRVKVSGFPPASGQTVTAEYESQFLAHSTMEPMNCTARVTRDQCEIWGPIQGQELTRMEVAAALQMAPEKVQVYRTLIGGGFGRRLWTDFSRQAALLSRAVGRPVQVVWTRETDIQHDIYRPAVLHRITAKVDEAGKALSLSHRLVSPSILHLVFPPITQAPFDPSCVEGTLEWHYRIPHWEVEFNQPKLPVPTSVLRTTGYGPNLFAIESLIDELAHRAKQDPYLYRRDLLADNTRALDVIDLAAEKSNWRQKPAPGHFRGIAFAEAFRTITAHVVELSLKRNDVKIHRVTCAFDCGIALDPDICKSSMEAAVAWGLTCAFKSEITFEKGGTRQSNFHDYPLLNISEMPPVEVHYRNSDAKLLGGTGEVGPVTLVPALTNALSAATGMRYRSLPLSRFGLRLA